MCAREPTDVPTDTLRVPRLHLNALFRSLHIFAYDFFPFFPLPLGSPKPHRAFHFVTFSPFAWFRALPSAVQIENCLCPILAVELSRPFEKNG